MKKQKEELSKLEKLILQYYVGIAKKFISKEIIRLEEIKDNRREFKKQLLTLIVKKTQGIIGKDTVNSILENEKRINNYIQKLYRDNLYLQMEVANKEGKKLIVPIHKRAELIKFLEDYNTQYWDIIKNVFVNTYLSTFISNGAAHCAECNNKKVLPYLLKQKVIKRKPYIQLFMKTHNELSRAKFESLFGKWEVKEVTRKRRKRSKRF